MHRRSILRFTATVLVVAAACSGSTDPGGKSNNNNNGSDPYPEIAGIYNIAAQGGCCGGSEEGTITLSQSSLTSASFTGTYSTRFRGPNGEGANGAMIEGTVSGRFLNASTVRLALTYPPNTSVTWTWNGAVTLSGGARITGTWNMVAPDGSSDSMPFTLTHQ